jgi:transposase
VRALLDTELGKRMSNVDIAKEAGVGEAYVRKVKQQLETRTSIAQCVSESVPKAITPRGLRPRASITRRRAPRACWRFCS